MYEKVYRQGSELARSILAGLEKEGREWFPELLENECLADRATKRRFYEFWAGTTYSEFIEAAWAHTGYPRVLSEWSQAIWDTLHRELGEGDRFESPEGGFKYEMKGALKDGLWNGFLQTMSELEALFEEEEEPEPCTYGPGLGHRECPEPCFGH